MAEPTSAFDLARQARRETEGCRRATERYRQEANHSTLDELPPGQALLKRLVPPLEAAIRDAQTTAQDTLGKVGRQAEWAWPVQLLAADKLAVLTLTTCLRGVVTGHSGEHAERPGAVTYVARAIATAVRLQVEYDTWAGEEEDVAAKLRHRFPTLTAAVWRRWRVKLEAARTTPWSPSQEVALGAMLVRCLCDTAPEWFSLEHVGVRGGFSRLHLRPSQMTLDLLSNITARAEVARPLLMPMIIPPNEWRYECQ